jgi:hypothetical protein
MSTSTPITTSMLPHHDLASNIFSTPTTSMRHHNHHNDNKGHGSRRTATFRTTHSIPSHVNNHDNPHWSVATSPPAGPLRAQRTQRMDIPKRRRNDDVPIDIDKFFSYSYNLNLYCFISFFFFFSFAFRTCAASPFFCHAVTTDRSPHTTVSPPYIS